MTKVTSNAWLDTIYEQVCNWAKRISTRSRKGQYINTNRFPNGLDALVGD